MAGKADRDGAREAWLEAVSARLTALIDQTISALAEPDEKPSDVAAIDRRARAITNIARAAKAVAALTIRAAGRAGDSAAGGAPEDRMSEDDIDDIDPAELERLRAELQSRLDLLRGAFERKGMAAWPFPAPDAPGDPGAAAPA